uniref:Uncharacterized protein n=1 Tax=Manihot esculenta TaxID=3983 RepID=A0A2C9WLH1_MANES
MLDMSLLKISCSYNYKHIANLFWIFHHFTNESIPSGFRFRPLSSQANAQSIMWRCRSHSDAIGHCPHSTKELNSALPSAYIFSKCIQLTW